MTRYIFSISIILLTVGILESKKFKLLLISADQCEIPAETIDPTKPVSYDIAVIKLNRHTRVVRTNFTVLRPLGPATMSLKINQLKQGPGKDEIFKLEKVDCHNPVTYQLIRVVNLKLTNECMAVPGNYLTEKINLQDFAWILTKAMIHPGKYEYVLEFYSNKGMVLCNSIICDIQEVK